MMATKIGYRPGVLLVLLTMFVAIAPGCASRFDPRQGSLNVRSRSGSGVEPAGGFSPGIYSLNDPSSITVLLIDGPKDRPNRAVIIRMFWKPKASITPLDETATNATVQYIVFPDGPQAEGGDPADAGGTGADKPQVGVYSGGGFLFPESKLGSPSLHANLWQATLSLSDKTDRFEDTLGPSILRGRFTARRDDEAILDAIRRINIAVSERLGEPRFVRAD